MTEESVNRFPAARLEQAGRDGVRTMSSIEIADLAGKRHPDVLRDIRNMLESLGMTFEQFCSKVPSDGGRPMTVAHLPRRECLILVSGYSIDLRARIIDRWEELERKERRGITADDLLGNPAQLLAITQGYALQIEDMKRDMSMMQSDVDAFERIGKADGSLSLREAAKASQMPEKKFIAYLMERRWCYRQPGTRTLLGYADKVRDGLIEHKVSTYSKSDGSEGIAEKARITAKGISRLSKMLSLQPSLV